MFDSESELFPSRAYPQGKKEPSGMIQCPMKQAGIAELRCWEIQKEIRCHCQLRVSRYRAYQLKKAMSPEPYHKGPWQRSPMRDGTGRLLEKR